LAKTTTLPALLKADMRERRDQIGPIDRPLGPKREGKSEWLQHEFANVECSAVIDRDTIDRHVERDVARLLMTNHLKGSRDRLFEGRALDLSF